MVTKITKPVKQKGAQRRGAKADVETEQEEKEQEAPVLLVTQVGNILDSIFSNAEVLIHKWQIYN